MSFYVWQMNDGRWHVSAETSKEILYSILPDHLRRGYDTRAEADAAHAEIREITRGAWLARVGKRRGYLYSLRDTRCYHRDDKTAGLAWLSRQVAERDDIDSAIFQRIG